MIVVSDTTPLRYLAVLGELELLPRLFGTVHCPDIVLSECLHPAAPAVLRKWAATPPVWLAVQTVAEIDPLLSRRLDMGEAAAITLAQRLHADVILIDEAIGRSCAISCGIFVAGTISILAQAGVRGWLDYTAATRTLREQSNFRISPAVIEAAWRAAQPS